MLFSTIAFSQTTPSWENTPSNSAGFYLDTGIGFVISHVNIFNDTSSIDSGGFAGVAFLGYQINQYFATEAGFNYLNTGNVMFPIAVKAILPLSADKRFKLFGKLGAAATNSDVEPFIGLGAAYAIMPDTDVAIEMNGTTGPFAGMGSTTLNVIYHF